MPAYTFRSVGATASNTDSAALSPGAPAGKATGDLLLLCTGNRASSLSLPALTGWTSIYAVSSAGGSTEILGRVADGSASDTPSPDWGGTNDSYAVILAYSGDVYTDQSTIVAHSNTNTSSPASNLFLPDLTGVTTANCLLFFFSQKLKTVTSDDCTTITAPAGVTKRVQGILSATSLMFAVGDVQQTTATDYGGDDWTRDGTNEALVSRGIIVALKTASPALEAIRLIWRM